MQLNISGHHLDVTEAINSYVEKKFKRIARHDDHVTNVHVVISVDRHDQRAEATLHGVGGEIFADAQSDDLYAAIDQLVDRIDRQILKQKEKRIERRQGKQ
ncbi:MAG: ribosome-associated translation inhibitor RaiA [Gammaproteobacteria bacterium]|nr:ribosome-associated translation inhibitor RaiA [Gammaproteobacteria bacterium]MCY4198503.1 ribosome-associated translation inhibitor RaiA [Gammaproteobacteria bacterium]MCY4276466.1 ribosome-associated translation inhibitor RaiA [Gammaproteobacteria bacterium]MCY4322441.1 ribosome-associated translation inhibitor RaiA [Gammaproteobacteria bacterium]